MSDIEGTSGVRVRFYGEHCGPFGKKPHAHLWTVWVHYPAEPLVDGALRQVGVEALAKALQPSLHQTLGDIATGEAMARWFLKACQGAVLVEVSRDEEGLSARAWRRGALG